MNSNAVCHRYLLKALAVISACLVMGMPAVSHAEGKGPKPGVLALDDTGAMRISPEDRCPVCGMKSFNYPNTHCAIQLESGRTFYFCGTRCMIRSWLHPETYLLASKSELKRAVIREYFTGETVDALSVMWVAGSDVVGPMGPAIVPLLEEHVSPFQRRHGGKSVFKLETLTDDDWMKIAGGKPSP